MFITYFEGIIKYSNDGGTSWFTSGGGYPTGTSVPWRSLASSSNGQIVVAGSNCNWDTTNNPGR